MLGHFLLLLVVCGSVTAQTFNHRFNYKGIELKISDEAADENGNHVLVGDFRIQANEEKDRDTMINRTFNLRGFKMNDRHGFMILTDNNYRIRKIVPAFVGKRIFYNPATKEFTILAGNLDYLTVNENSFSAWQPVIMVTKSDLRPELFFIPRPYSCIAKDMIIDKSRILIFARSQIRKIEEHDAENAEVIKVDLSKTYTDKEHPWKKCLTVLSDLVSEGEDGGRMNMSDVSFVKGVCYFSTSNLDQFTLKDVLHFYTVAYDSLREIPYFSEVVKGDIERGWVVVNHFSANDTTFKLLVHAAATKKQMTYATLNHRLRVKVLKKIPMNYYGDYNRLLTLPDGNNVILAAGKTENWSYFLFSPQMELISEYDSGLSKKYYPSRLISAGNNKIEGLFYLHQTGNTDCVLQIITF